MKQLLHSGLFVALPILALALIGTFKGCAL